MYTRYYDSYPQEFSKSEVKAITSECTGELSKSENTTDNSKEIKAETAAFSPIKKAGKFNSEDLLLVALIFLIATESDDDFIMPLVLGALLLG